MSQERKYFFFEKKKQKTFIHLPLACTAEREAALIDKSFLVLFFKKRTLLLTCLQRRPRITRRYKQQKATDLKLKQHIHLHEAAHDQAKQ